MKATLKPHWSFERFLPVPAVDGDWAAVEISDWLSDIGDVHLGIMESINNSPSFEEVDIERGNAHELNGLGDNLLLQCFYVYEQKALLTKKQLIDVLQKYKEHYYKKNRDQQNPPPSFEIEYEAGGEDALKKYQALGGKEGMTREDMEFQK